VVVRYSSRYTQFIDFSPSALAVHELVGPAGVGGRGWEWLADGTACRGAVGGG
jgi:hypothetical protein